VAPVPILLACRQLTIGGSERQLAETARALDRSRFEPHVAVFHAEGVRMDELTRAGVPVLALPVQSFHDFTAVEGGRILRHYVRNHRIRLIHSFDVPLNVFTTFSFVMGRRPVILTSQRGHRTLSGSFYHRLSRVADRLTDGIVVNCEYMRRHLIQDENILPDLVDLCYNGVDTNRFSPGDGNRPPNLRAASPLIGTVCALRREKDIPTLLGAFAAVHAVNPAARLVMVGSGPEQVALERIVRESGLTDAVVFEPATGDVAPWLRAFDLFVLPSREEALSNAIIEAMACGACVVASDAGGNPELTGENGERGMLFPVGDQQQLAAHLLELGSDPEARARISREARRWVEETLAIQVAANRMAGIYDKHLNQKTAA
jgi:L-malate glycosyltransferase